MSLEHIGTELMIVDHLTKDMSLCKFKDHVERMRFDFTL